MRNILLSKNEKEFPAPSQVLQRGSAINRSAAMLQDVSSEISHFCTMVATVTGIDIEVVDMNLMRVAGTGVYLDDVGKSIKHAGAIYERALKDNASVLVANAKDNELCQTCTNRYTCRELLTLCTPISLNGRVLGIIGLICFTEKDRSRVLAQQGMYIEFVEQIAKMISRHLESSYRNTSARQILDAFLQVTNTTMRGFLVLNAEGNITYFNDVAKSEFKLDDNYLNAPVEITKKESQINGMDEYEIHIDGHNYVALGHVFYPDPPTPDVACVLFTESKPRWAQMMGSSAVDNVIGNGVNSIIGSSRQMVNLKRRIKKIARTSSTVLLTGESGTGKEMIARAIHAESDRADKPFIAINCGAIPDNLLESELFGYVKGAFTGANASGRMGKFELANTGVLFLDEIGSLPIYLQVKLLRVLQEKAFTRLGSNRLMEVDVRIIAATNDNLQQMIEERTFRDDLYYRLSVIPLELPPLRRRKDDIPLLAEYFLDRYCERFHKPPLRLSFRMMDMLCSYAWPGNVREFENCIEFLVNMHEGGALTPSLLPEKIRQAYRESLQTGSGHEDTPLPVLQTGLAGQPDAPVITLDEIERQAIRNAIQHFGDTTDGKKLAAEALGIGIATLYRKLKLYEL